VLAVEMQYKIPMWTSIAAWSTITLALTFLMLPRAKGVILSFIWSTNAPGSERD